MILVSLCQWILTPASSLALSESPPPGFAASGVQVKDEGEGGGQGDAEGDAGENAEGDAEPKKKPKKVRLLEKAPSLPCVLDEQAGDAHGSMERIDDWAYPEDHTAAIPCWEYRPRCTRKVDGCRQAAWFLSAPHWA